MFGLFRPKCPVDIREKVWTERSMTWLAEQFGMNRMLNAQVILPTAEHFPEEYQGSDRDVRRLLDCVCRFMHIDTREVALEFLTEQEFSPLGYYGAGDKVTTSSHWSTTPRRKQAILDEAGGRLTVCIQRSALRDREIVIANLIYEVSHWLLANTKEFAAIASDQTEMAELLAVFFGIGIPLTNTAIKQHHDQVGCDSWTWMTKQGHLPARVLGYAWALFAWMRAEKPAAWAAFLRLDARNALEGGLRYLDATGDSLFHPNQPRTKKSHLFPSDMIAEVRGEHPGRRLNGIWDLRAAQLTTGEQSDAITAVEACLREANLLIRSEAIQTLAALGAASQSAHRFLLDSLHDTDWEIKRSAAATIGAVSVPADQAVAPLALLLADDHRGVVEAAARSLARYGTDAHSAMHALARALRNALVICDPVHQANIVDAVMAITSDPRAALAPHFADDDEMLALANRIVRDRSNGRL